MRLNHVSNLQWINACSRTVFWNLHECADFVWDVSCEIFCAGWVVRDVVGRIGNELDPGRRNTLILCNGTLTLITLKSTPLNPGLSEMYGT